MVKAHDWLNTNYPKNQRNDINLDLSNKNLEGDLDLTDFTKLRTLTVASQYQYQKNWTGFYQWLNDNVVDINEKDKGNIKANKRSEYPGLCGPNDGSMSLLMNAIESSLGITQLDYIGRSYRYKDPLLPYDDNKTFFQLANGKGTALPFIFLIINHSSTNSKTS